MKEPKPILTDEEIDELVQISIDGGVRNMRVIARMIQHATLQELAARIQQMPFGDTASSFATYIRRTASPNWDFPGREQL